MVGKRGKKQTSKRSQHIAAVDALIARGALKPSSRNWLISALDPFHDYQFDLEGLPDQFGSSTCVQLIKRQVVIRPPAGIVAGQTWDAHIFSAPLLTTQVARSYSYNVNRLRQYDAAAGAGSAIGGLGTVNVASAINTGATPFNLLPTGLSPAAGWTAPTGWSCVSFSPADGGNSFGQMRMVSGGFEVHNTTAELYKQGNCVVYSQPNTLALTEPAVFYAYSTAPANVLPANVLTARLPPASLQEVLLNTNAKSWEAAYGCYVPFRIQPQEANYAQATSSPLILTSSDSSLDYANYYLAYGVQCESGANQISTTQNPIRLQAMHTVGAYFSGLGPESVLTLDLRFFVEIAPTPSNPTLLSLASPSPPFDPLALELYTQALAELLPGCMVNENASGKWWQKVKSAIDTVIPVVSTMGPYGAALGAGWEGIKGVAGAVEHAVSTRKAQKDASKKKGPPEPKKPSAPPTKK